MLVATQTPEASARPRRLPVEQLQALFAALAHRGLRVLGPTVRDGAIVLGELGSARELPWRITDEQAPGRYRLHTDADAGHFGYNVGPQSFKRSLFPAEERLLQIRRSGGGRRPVELRPEPPPGPGERWAFLGVRACDLAAIAVQDRVFLGGGSSPGGVDGHYRARRAAAFLIAVECTRAAPTCFCASMGTGPAVDQGSDLVLTEVVEGERHFFLCLAGSPEGQSLLDELPTEPASDAELDSGQALVARAAVQTRALDTAGIKEDLYAAAVGRHRRWDEVAERCLSCGNCTLVCPTCFCSTVEDRLPPGGELAERVRLWDSCFNLDHSYLHGGPLRQSVSSRYRQWLTHKLASWIDQFGTSGCVGCGRCITFCPVGIDLTEEVAALRLRPASDAPAPQPGGPPST